MCCNNFNCDYLTREGRHDYVNEKLWYGHALKNYLDQPLYLIILLFARSTKFFVCLTICSTMMYWITCDTSTLRAYILGLTITMWLAVIVKCHACYGINFCKRLLEITSKVSPSSIAMSTKLEFWEDELIDKDGEEPLLISSTEMQEVVYTFKSLTSHTLH